MALDADDRKALERIQRICLALPGVDEGELQGRPLFRVGRRRFAIFNGVGSPPRSRWQTSGRLLHFLNEPAEHEALRNVGRFIASPHHGDRGWLSFRFEEGPDWREVAELLDAAYRQVAPPTAVDESARESAPNFRSALHSVSMAVGTAA